LTEITYPLIAPSLHAGGIMEWWNSGIVVSKGFHPY
jgi:hypothetical protein